MKQFIKKTFNVNPRTYMQIHTPTVVQGGMDGTPARAFDMLQ